MQSAVIGSVKLGYHVLFINRREVVNVKTPSSQRRTRMRRDQLVVE